MPRRVRGATHAERLESFYAAQADGYDTFRRRLLHGREQMIRAATFHSARGGTNGGIWADLGGGTGANLEMVGEEIVMSFAKIYVVDLCPSLLAVARKRCAERGWHHVECVEADATQWVAEEGEGKLSLVTFSYSLTMAPDWWAAIQQVCAFILREQDTPRQRKGGEGGRSFHTVGDSPIPSPPTPLWTFFYKASHMYAIPMLPSLHPLNSQAALLLKPHGTVGVVDFYVSRKYPAAGLMRHSYCQRNLWPYYFAHDNVSRLPPCVSRLVSPAICSSSSAPAFCSSPLAPAFGPRIRPLPRTLTLHAARLSTRCLFPL